MRAVFPALILLASAAFAQQPKPAPGKEAADAFLAQRKRLRDEAKATFDREMAREKAGQCKDASSTRDNVVCLNTEAESTQANFEIYVRGIRALLALKNPYQGDAAQAAGPTGIPLTGEQQRQQFDKVEAAWQDYSKTACDAAYDLYKGGTIAPMVEIGCQQSLIRSHLRELEALYGDYFSH